MVAEEHIIRMMDDGSRYIILMTDKGGIHPTHDGGGMHHTHDCGGMHHTHDG